LFRRFLKEVLSLHETLGVRAKAYRIMPQHQHVFRGSEIYSDIRAIFRPEHIDVKPSAAVIVHSLKIRYYENYEEKAIYFGLSDNDLHELKDNVERAIKKHDCLKTMIGNFGIQCLEEEE
jgi:threonine dehydratase